MTNSSAASALPTAPIFVVGSPRSGTTLMKSILDAHPRIFCPTWETGLFVSFEAQLNGDLRKLMNEGDPFPLDRAAMCQWARDSVELLFERLRKHSGKPRWAEKTPAHVLSMDLIAEVYPEAQFIHIIRNGYEVVRSLQNMPWAPRRIKWSIARWMDSVRAGRQSGAKLAPGHYHELRYEDLTKQPEPVVRAICDFLGEEFDSQMLDFHKPRNNSWSAEFKPIQDRPVNKYQELGWLERRIFEHRAKPLMKELSYR